MRKFGDMATSKSGRVYEWIEPGWWQMKLTDEEKQILASGEVPREWHPTTEEIAAAEESARRLLGTKPMTGRDRRRKL